MIDDPWQPQYVGPPSPELDSAWNTLLIGVPPFVVVIDGTELTVLGSDTDLGGNEADSVRGTTGKDPNTGLYRIR